MKKIYFSTIAAAMVALLSFTSCDKPVPTPPLPSISPGEITLSAEDITATSAVVKAKPTNAQGTYHINVVSKAQYDELGSDNALITKDVAGLIKLAAADGKTLVDYLTTALLTGDKSFSATLDMPETEYYAYAYGLGADGKATTDVVKVTFTSTAAPIAGNAFTISVTEITATSARFTIVPKDDKMLYYFENLNEGEYTKYGSGTKEGIAKFLSEHIASECKDSGQTPEEFIKTMGSTGEDGFKYSGLRSKTNYYAFAVAIDASGVVIGEPTIKMFTTEETPLSNLTFEVNVANITPSSAHITITPSNLTEKYFYDYQTVAACNTAGTDNDLIYALISMYGGIQNKLKTGVNEYLPSHFEGSRSLKPNTDYYVLAWGYTDSPTTLLKKVKFTTGEEVVDPNATFAFDLKVAGPRQVKLQVTPSNNNVRYMRGIVSAADFNKMNKDVKACLQVVYDYWGEHGNTPEMIATRMSLQGPTPPDQDFVGLEPSTEYHAWAICVKADGTMVGNGSISEKVTTEVLVESQATITFAYSKFYDGDKLHEYDPVIYPESVKGKAFVPVTVTPSPAAVRWCSALAEGDQTDPTKLSERGVIQNVMISNENKTNPIFLAPWDKQVTFLGYAQDKDNGVGLAARKAAIFSKAMVSPISDLTEGKAPKANVSYTNMLISKYTAEPIKMPVVSKDASTLNSATPILHTELGTLTPATSKRAVVGRR